MWDWLDGLLGAGDAIGADIAAFLTYLLGLLVAIFEFLYQLLVAIFNYLLQLMKDIGKFFQWLWQDVLKGILGDLWSAIVKVHDWLENLLQPIIDFLNKLRQWVQWIFTTYIKPFLNLLQQIRGFLNILKAFGVKWAAQLDQILGQVQADIIGAFQKAMGYINAIIGIVNSLADPLGLFRRPTFVMSMRRIFPSFMRGVSGMPVGYFFPSPGKNPGAGMGVPPSPLNLSDPTQNPPPSGYFGDDDGLGDFGGWDGTDPLADSDADDMTAMDYFDDDQYPDPVCSDPSQCAQDAFSALLGGSSFVSS
jgi:hypothetical protein